MPLNLKIVDVMNYYENDTFCVIDFNMIKLFSSPFTPSNFFISMWTKVSDPKNIYFTADVSGRKNTLLFSKEEIKKFETPLTILFVIIAVSFVGFVVYYVMTHYIIKVKNLDDIFKHL